MIRSEEIDKYLLVSKDARGKACEPFISQIISNPHIFHFKEFLSLPNIVELKNTASQPYYNLLNLFTYENYNHYKANTSKYPTLNLNQLRKLKQLSFLDIAATQKLIKFDVLMLKLDINDQRELEDLIIDSIYAGIIDGKINQEKRLFKVFWVSARDPKETELASLLNQLKMLKQDAKLIEDRLNTDIIKMNEAKLAYLENHKKLEEDKQKAIQTALAQGKNIHGQKGQN